MSTAWTDLLNELNRDVSREQPSDHLQWGADWFQSRLRNEVCLSLTTMLGTHYSDQTNDLVTSH